MRQKSFKFHDEEDGWGVGVGGHMEADVAGVDFVDFRKLPTVHKKDIFFGSEEPMEETDSAMRG